MQNIIRDEEAGIIRFETKRMGVTVSRPSYWDKEEKQRWVKRFYYAKMINGELARFPLSATPSDAETMADKIAAFLSDPTNTLEAAKRKFNPRALLRPSEFSTIGELLDFHRDNWKILELSAKSGEGYHGCLMLILRRVDAWHKGEEFATWSGRRIGMDVLLAPWREKPTTLLTERLATDYQRLMVPADIEDEEEEITQKITCDTNLRSARAIFSREAMKLFASSPSINLPDLSGFMGVTLFNAKKYFVLPEPDVIRRIFTAAPELRASDLNAYRAFLVCAQCGLRKSEASNFRIDWMREEDSPAILIHEDGRFKPKHGHGRKVFLDAWAAEEIRGLGGDRKYFLDGTDTERSEAVFMRLNAWLRSQGVTATKPTHELRKLWFSQKAKREGLTAAAQQGGHRDVKTTTDFYASSLMPDNVLPFWQETTLAALAKTAKKTA